MSGSYHAGELAVQARAGVQEMAQRVKAVIDKTMSPAAQEFLQRQPMVIVASVDARDQAWASVLTGPPGFMVADNDTTLHIGASPAMGDPLHDNLFAGTDVGLLFIDFATRLRLRVNGRAEPQEDGTFRVHARQVYGNCKKYIQARQVELVTLAEQKSSNSHRSERPTATQERWITRADTFFVATAHLGEGADASHRGGNPGFVSFVGPDTLIWPDYMGNMMFNTLGNIAARPQAGLLFLDFETGSTLQLSGQASIIWDEAQIAQYNGAERLLSYEIEQVIEVEDRLPFRWQFESYSPFNP